MYVKTACCKSCDVVPRGAKKTLRGLSGGFSSSTTPSGPVPNKYLGTACPNGQEAVGGGQKVGGGDKYVLCVPIKQAVAAPPPAPSITVAPVITTAVSPNLQQQFTPQVSPVFQQSSGSGSQGAGTEQQAGGGQSGAGGGSAGPGASTPTTGQGVTATDLLAVLNAQAEQARRDREAASADQAARQREQQEYFASQLAMQRQQQEATAAAEASRRLQAEEQARQQAAAQQAAEQRAAQQAAALAVHSQYTGPTSAPSVATVEPVMPTAQLPVAGPKKDQYTVPITVAVILAIATGVYLTKKKGLKK